VSFSLWLCEAEVRKPAKCIVCVVLYVCLGSLEVLSKCFPVFWCLPVLSEKSNFTFFFLQHYCRHVSYAIFIFLNFWYIFFHGKVRVGHSFAYVAHTVYDFEGCLDSKPYSMP
jgi:hypothetical protein